MNCAAHKEQTLECGACGTARLEKSGILCNFRVLSYFSVTLVGPLLLCGDCSQRLHNGAFKSHSLVEICEKVCDRYINKLCN